MAQPPTPQVQPLVGTPQQRLQQIMQALSRKADVTSEPTYNAVLLVAPDGAAWRLSVNTSGALITTAVSR